MELIKEQNYYVPKEYLESVEFLEHAIISSPMYIFDEETKKWRLSFCGSDLKGDDSQDFYFYFDSEEDLLKFLKE